MATVAWPRLKSPSVWLQLLRPVDSCATQPQPLFFAACVQLHLGGIKRCKISSQRASQDVLRFIFCHGMAPMAVWPTKPPPEPNSPPGVAPNPPPSSSRGFVASDDACHFVQDQELTKGILCLGAQVPLTWPRGKNIKSEGSQDLQDSR